MVRKKKLSPSGTKDENGEFHNAHLSLNEDELEAAGFKIGDEVFVRVRENMLLIQKAEEWPERESIVVERRPHENSGK
ncbi:hypothetical protein AKJ64_00500 [candidate division MSBL1 archaeon SCGC-AAA259E17]|uniref:Uncharacterized protein n=1 Tax=candidate division MSBL1 archaeon SCGC-AAA259E17 TaxID=1698263 RepID=A0A133UH90_9EURY|nr:hypothetical protein AKJ64_00500 [candidate division MSBL1 archaeon SCGC-AAA259E17]